MEKLRYSKGKRFLQNSLKTNKFSIGADKILLLFTILSVLYSLYIVILGKNNIFRYIEKERIKDKLQEEISYIQKENSELKKEISYLKNDLFFVEKKAREDLGMVKDGEEIYITVDKKKKKQEKQQRWIDSVIKKYQEFILRK